MAISQNSSILYTDLKSKYDSFNTFITNYGGSIAKLTVPANSPAKVNASDINNLNSKINEFKADTYLKTQASWWVNKTVTAGNLAYASDWTNINTTISNFAKVKCRNQGTNSNTYHSNTCSNGTCNKTCSQGTRSVACNPNGTHNNTCSQGTRSVACNPNGTHNNTCSQGTRSVACNPNGNCNNTCSQGTRSVACNPNGNRNNTCSNGSCSRTSGAGLDATGSDCYFTCTGLLGCQYSNASWTINPSITWSKNAVSCSLSSRTVNFTLTGCTLTGKARSTTYMTFKTDTTSRCVNVYGTAVSGTWQYTINSCTYSTNSVACNPNGTYNNTCSNGANSVACNPNGTHNNTCSNGANSVACGTNGNRNHQCSNGPNSVSCGTNGNRNHNCNNGPNSQACSHGTNSVSCNNVKKSNTTYIDITCTHASKNNG